MNWWLGLLGVVLVFTGWCLRRMRTPQPAAAASPDPDPDLPLDPALDELSSAAVVALLEPVIRRAAPLRGIRRDRKSVV